MIHLVFSIHDSKAKAYLPPFVLPTTAMAKRVFSDCINDKDHAFGRHPHDYTLFQLGVWNDEDSQYNLEKAPKTLGNGVEFIEPDTQPQLELVNHGEIK